jgi:VWFA-related protein
VALARRSEPQPPQEDTGTVFRSDTRIVVLHVTVVKERPPGDHLGKAFQVFENGHAADPQFKREDAGVARSGGGQQRQDARQAAKVRRRRPGKVSNRRRGVLVNFNDEAFLDNPHGKDFTSDVKEMEEALTRIDSRGGTAMRDAVRMSIDHVKEKAKKDKKVLVVVTDGNDNSSAINLENLVKAAQQSEVILYGIGILSEEERREAKRAQRALDALAQATGGQSYFPKDVADVDRIAQQVARDVRNQYTVVYSPSNPSLDGSYRQIKVTANAPGKPSVRTRSGYYATPDGASNSTKASGE